MNVLVLSAHPDDETLGAGGTLLAHRAAGDSIAWLIATAAYEPVWSAEVIARKSAEVAAAAQAYGISRVEHLRHPAARLDDVPLVDVIAPIRRMIEEHRPEVIYLPHPGDIHTDHAVLFDAALAALRAFRSVGDGVKRILCYEILSSTDSAPPQRLPRFVPNVYRDISAHIHAKLDAMAIYETEAQPDPLPRGPSAIRALARFRGATIGVEHAEVFELVREVIL